jgi:hypothetical protein
MRGLEPPRGSTASAWVGTGLVSIGLPPPIRIDHADWTTLPPFAVLGRLRTDCALAKTHTECLARHHPVPFAFRRNRPPEPVQGLEPGDPVPSGFPFDLQDERLDAVLRDMLSEIPGGAIIEGCFLS